MNKRSGIVFLLVFILCLGIVNNPIHSETITSTKYKQEVHNRKMEIYQEYIKMKAKKSPETNLYEIQPLSQYPYMAGQLKQTVLDSALATTNFVRSLAYLNSDVQLDASWNEMAQHAAVVNASNGILSHEPTQKSDMPNDFYQLGYTGASTSNVYFGYISLDETITKYVYDSDDKNIDRMGHRRWILNPAMTKVGFGYTNTGGYNSVYSAMKIFADKENSIFTYKGAFDYVAWPSKGAFPTEYFSDTEAWTVVLNHKIYDNKKLDQIQVILENTTTGDIQTFSKTQGDGYFNIETSEYGAPFCIIFKPNGLQYSEGAHYKVTINGLWDLQGKSKVLTYETEFFSISTFQSILEENEKFADMLSQMGVFRGSDKGYELERAPTRLEGMVMLIRLLGKEKEALSMAKEPCVFTDVPSWGKGYVNYGYKAGLTKGIGKNLFGSSDVLDASAYMTFMLRALGYSDTVGDFKWALSLEKGKELGIISQERYERLKKNLFIRGDGAAISYFTLKSKIKGESLTLLHYLINEGTIGEAFINY